MIEPDAGTKHCSVKSSDPSLEMQIREKPKAFCQLTRTVPPQERRARVGIRRARLGTKPGKVPFISCREFRTKNVANWDWEFPSNRSGMTSSGHNPKNFPLIGGRAFAVNVFQNRVGEFKFSSFHLCQECPFETFEDLYNISKLTKTSTRQLVFGQHLPQTI